MLLASRPVPKSLMLRRIQMRILALWYYVYVSSSSYANKCCFAFTSRNINWLGVVGHSWYFSFCFVSFWVHRFPSYSVCIWSWQCVTDDWSIGKTFLVQLLLANLEQPAPNVTHLLLKFDVNQLVERTMLQPKRHFRQEPGSISPIIKHLSLCLVSTYCFLNLTQLSVLQLFTSDTRYIGQPCKAGSECWTAWTWFPGEVATLKVLYG